MGGGSGSGSSGRGCGCGCGVAVVVMVMWSWWGDCSRGQVIVVAVLVRSGDGSRSGVMGVVLG